MVLESVNKHMSVGRNSKGTLELMTAALRAQFARYEISWQESMIDVEEDVLFDELEEICGTTEESVHKALAEIDTLAAAHDAKMNREVTPKAMPPVEAVLPDSGESEAMPPVAGETEAVLPDSGESEAMPPVARETEAVLLESGEPEAMLSVARETEAASPDTGETEVVSPVAQFPAYNVKLNVERDVTPEAMSPDALTLVAKPKPLPGGGVVALDPGQANLMSEYSLACSRWGSNWA